MNLTTEQFHALSPLLTLATAAVGILIFLCVERHHGAAAMLLDDGTILTGTAPDAINPSVEVCHETEPYCAAFRLGRRIVASVCLYREPGGRTLVLSPCGVCRERLAVHGPNVLVAVADVEDATRVVWKPIKDVLPDYWMKVFPDAIDPGWAV